MIEFVLKYKCYYLFTLGCIESFPYDINSVWYFTLKKCLNNKLEYPKYMHGLVVKFCSCRFVNWKYRLEHAWWCYLSQFWLLNWQIHFRLTVVGDWQFKKSLFWDVEFREMCMLIFPVQSIAYFHVVLVVRHTLKYLFLIVLNYRVIDAYIFLRYLVNKCTHIMHNLQKHMLRVLLFFTVLLKYNTFQKTISFLRLCRLFFI